MKSTLKNNENFTIKNIISKVNQKTKIIKFNLKIFYTNTTHKKFYKFNLYIR